MADDFRMTLRARDEQSGLSEVRLRVYETGTDELIRQAMQSIARVDAVCTQSY